MAMHLRTSALALLLAGARASSMSMTDDYSFVFANKSSSVGGGSTEELARPRYVTQPQDHFDDVRPRPGPARRRTPTAIAQARDTRSPRWSTLTQSGPLATWRGGAGWGG